MYIYSVINHAQQANCKRFLATSFGSTIEPSCGHYTRTEKQKPLEVMDAEVSAFLFLCSGRMMARP
jgi:hypothetical protein